MNELITISAYTRLSETQLSEVGILAQTVRETGIDPRVSLEWLAERDGTRMSEWLAHVDGQLIGLLSTAVFGGVLEATLAIAPSAPPTTAQALFAALLEDLPNQPATQVLLLHDRKATQLRQLADTLQLSLDHSEHAMRRPADLPPVIVPNGPLHVHMASEAELPQVAQVSATDWGADLVEVLTQVRNSFARGGVDYYLATLDGTPVSALNIQWLEGRPWVYGFSVSQAYRGRGFGRQTISFALADALARSPGDAFLEVDPGNATAITLYQSLGFAVQQTFDYWAKELVHGKHS